ncbi:MAG: Wzz/FepE/Etk N-terminal domain-containing protein, partial [Fimbriimonadales bacterium]
MERWAEREETVSLAWLRNALVAQWRWIALGTVFGIALGILLIATTPKRYEGQAKIFIDSGGNLATGGQLSMLLGTGSPDVNTQVEILLSRALLERVQQKSGINEPYREFAGRFNASAVRNTNLVNVSAQSDTPESAAELTNLWVQEYLQFVREFYDQNPSTLVEKLSKELDTQEKALREQGQKIVAFLKAKQAVMPDEELKQAIQSYVALQQKIQENEAKQRGLARQFAEVRAQLGRQPQFMEQARTIGVPPEVQQLNNKIAELEIQRTILLEEFQPTAPEVKQVEAQLAQARQEREKLLQRAVDDYFAVLGKTESVNPTYQTLLLASLQLEAEQGAIDSSLGYLRAERERLESRLREAPGLLAEFNDLQRQYQASLTIWTEKTRAYEQARAQQLVGRVSPIALERAPLPDRPIAPRPVLYTTVLATL